MPPVQALFTQVWPLAQTVVQLPQCWGSLVVLKQVPLHNIWPATVQAQAPFWHFAPPEHMVPQVPQLASLVGLGHEPPAHGCTPPPQSLEQALLLHTIVPIQVTPHIPQLLLFDWTHAPLQLRSPEPQVHTPA